MKRLLLPLVFVLALLPVSCTGRDADLAGTYVAEAQDGASVTLELKRDGKAALRFDGETTGLTWEEHGAKTIWLHTAEGGVISANRQAGDQGEGWELEIPGGRRLTFWKQR